MASLLRASTAWAATLFDPALRFKQISTAHFVIYFHQGEDQLASRLAGIAEDVWLASTKRLDLTPPARTYVVLADHTDTPNGWATPQPYNLIVIVATAPSGADFIGHTSDWLRTVFTHEFTHILHLDQARGWARGVRRVFGRIPLAFPNLFLPTWQIEGLATFHEGVAHGDGRLHARDFREVERAQAATGHGFPMDRANGGLTAWPGGWAPYAHGTAFHRYLSDRFGNRTFGELASRTAGRIPYTGTRSYKRVYGQSLGELWTDYQRDRVHAATLSGEALADQATRVTDSGFVAIGPRFAPAACHGCAQQIIYSRRTPHDFPSLMSVSQTGGPARALTRRYLGSTAAVTHEAVIFDQQEIRRNAGLYADLYALDRRSGAVTRLTREARVGDPDVTPDGRRLVAVRQQRGRRDLITAELERGLVPGPWVVIASERETQFAAPRWSPDGRLIAAERRQLGGRSEIVVVDPATSAIRVVATGATRAVTPAWRPDGRAIVAAADATDHPFTLFEFDIDGVTPPRRLTHRMALWPDVSADGRLIAFVGMTDRGFDVFTAPYSPTDPLESPASPPAVSLARSPSSTTLTTISGASSYSPWRTLVPTAWTPTLTLDRSFTKVGVLTSMFDPLGYHTYVASAAWLTNTPPGAEPISRTTPDWDVSYLYGRFRPQLFARTSRSTAFVPQPDAGSGSAPLRERREEVGLVLPVRRVQWTERALFSARRETGHLASAHAQAPFNRVALRAGWALSTVQQYGYSISPEHGVALGLTVETAGPTTMAIGEALSVKGDGRIFVPGLAQHHVLAVRLAGARSRGPRAIRRTFGLGGSGGATDVLDLGVDAVSLLRGFPVNRFAGSNVALLNADYRWPLVRVERGVGTWPAFVHTVHASVFTDVGHAWMTGFRVGDLKTSAGLELSLNLVAGYALPITVTAGAAWRRDPARAADRGPAAYVRVGRAF